VRARGGHATIADFLPVIRAHGLLPDSEYRALCAAITRFSDPRPAEVFNELDIPLTVGFRTQQTVESYTQVEYPLGYPAHSGQSARDSALLNRDWIVCEYQVVDSRKKSPANIYQVNELLESLEDESTTIDIEIARNASVLRFFLEKGEMSGYPSAMVLTELVATYGRGGGIMIPLILRHPTILYPKLIGRLRERGVALRAHKLRSQREWAMQLERSLPSQSAKYQNTDFFGRYVFPVLGVRPMRFNADHTSLIIEFFQILHCTWRTAETAIALEKAKDITCDLRKTNDNFVASFAHAGAVLSAALFLSLLADVPEIDKRSGETVIIPIEIGITEKEQHGHSRLLRIIVDGMAKRKWQEAAYEMAGLFQMIPLTATVAILRAGEALAKWTSVWAGGAKSDFDLVTCHIGSGSVHLTSCTDPQTAIGLDLARQDVSF
jgi:hypothetical protein